MMSKASSTAVGSTAANNNKTTGPTRSCIIQDGRKKVHITDGPDEIVEEYDLKSDLLLTRRRRTITFLGRQTEWVYEIGEPPLSAKNVGGPGGAPELGLVESGQNPKLYRLDHPAEFQFRIRNLPYPKPTYQLSIEDRQIVLRTTNKKYFTKICIPDMDRLNIPMDPAALSFDYGANTLLIKYRKPPAILERERKEREERAKLKPENAKDGDVDCKQQ